MKEALASKDLELQGLDEKLAVSQGLTETVPDAHAERERQPLEEKEPDAHAEGELEPLPLAAPLPDGL